MNSLNSYQFSKLQITNFKNDKFRELQIDLGLRRGKRGGERSTSKTLLAGEVAGW
jgi:hypothetical protein